MAQKAEAHNESTIEIQIGTLGGELKSFVLEEGATVTDALNAAGYPEDSKVRVNGEVFEDGDKLDDGDKLLVIQKAAIKGGS